MAIHVLTVPYDSAHYNIRMGAGPLHLIDCGLVEMLQAAGHEVVVEGISPSHDFHTEIATAFDLQRQVAERLQASSPANSFPLVLSGNCNTAVGTMSGIGAESIGVIWFDAHGDFNTPETTVGGYLDGMAVAIATGRCWTDLAARTSGFVPIADERVLFIGTRDLDAKEQVSLDQSGCAVVGAELIRDVGMSAALASPLTRLRSHAPRVYLHLDLDVLDPAIAPANVYAAAGGLTLEELRAAIRLIREQCLIVACGVASYDPAFDPDGRLSRTALELIREVVGS